MRSQSESPVFKFLQPSADEKRLLRSQSESRVFKFLQPSVDEKHLMRFQNETPVFKLSGVGANVHLMLVTREFTQTTTAIEEQGQYACLVNRCGFLTIICKT